MDQTTKPFIGNAFPGIETAAAYVHGELAKLAMPVLRAYHSDLYHDALWIHEHVKGDAIEFFYSFNDTGTCIGTDSALVMTRPNVHHIHVLHTGRGIEVRIQSVA